MSDGDGVTTVRYVREHHGVSNGTAPAFSPVMYWPPTVGELLVDAFGEVVIVRELLGSRFAPVAVRVFSATASDDAVIFQPTWLLREFAPIEAAIRRRRPTTTQLRSVGIGG